MKILHYLLQFYSLRVKENFITWDRADIAPKHTLLLFSRSVMSDSLQSYGLWPARLLCSWDSSGKHTGWSCQFLLQGIFPSQGSNQYLLQVSCTADGFLTAEPLGSPNMLMTKHSMLFTSTCLPPWSRCLLFSSITTSEDKTPRSIISKVVVVPTCRVTNRALDQRQKLLQRWPWCFLDLHPLENRGKKNSIL